VVLSPEFELAGTPIFGRFSTHIFASSSLAVVPGPVGLSAPLDCVDCLERSLAPWDLARRPNRPCRRSLTKAGVSSVSARPRQTASAAAVGRSIRDGIRGLAPWPGRPTGGARFQLEKLGRFTKGETRRSSCGVQRSVASTLYPPLVR